jgi:hypothetical protein
MWEDHIQVETTQKAVQALAPIVTKEPFYLHMASSLATVGIVASQKVI